jgi:hypothetical protein
MGAAFEVLHLPLASEIVPGGFSTVPTAGFPSRLIPFQGRFIGGGSCRVPAVLLLIGISVSWYITGAYLIAIHGPFEVPFVFSRLTRQLI